MHTWNRIIYGVGKSVVGNENGTQVQLQSAEDNSLRSATIFLGRIHLL